MKRLHITDLQAHSEGHVLQDVLPGKYLYRGGLAFEQPGARTHTNDGPDGKDYHVHEDCEAFVILQGKGRLELNKELFAVSSGDIFIIEPGEDHHLISDREEPLIILWCHAGPEPYSS